MTSVLVVDNYDSFVFTLDAYLRELGARTTVVENDDFAAADAPLRIRGYDAVLVSPGPGTPADAGVSIAVVRAAIDARIPLLGVCLGHQALAEALGATVAVADELMHGRTSSIRHDGTGLFGGLPQPFTATRYHSLAVVDGTVPPSLRVTARTDAGTIMALQHVSAPAWGVQFHPESVMTESGYQLLGNWLESAGNEDAARRGAGLSPLRRSADQPVQ
ncbi:aminodeoxychorismate/anthranilate synthase component II [Microbacteriaceae bacterium VKM Ac-2855]|nr:aminodeoxychorismate/anthranilate synthase component II [Microbacteriaceae bacterium VKM Ac-2855]